MVEKQLSAEWEPIALPSELSDDWQPEHSDLPPLPGFYGGLMATSR